MRKSSRKIRLKANFEVSLVKQKRQQQQTKQKTNFIWFDPPFSVNVNTKVGYYFLNLIRKHFPPRHRLFNVTPSKQLIATCQILKPKYTNITNTFQKNLSKNMQIPSSATVQIKSSTLLNGQCLAESIAYQANIRVTILGYKEKVDLGTLETTFKVSYANHKKLLTK